MGIERRISRDNDLKAQKLEKTKARRQKLDAQRRLAERASGNRRNDLLPSLAIRQVQISSLRDAPRKVRRRDPDQVERLVGAIARFGFTVPILVSGDEVLDGQTSEAIAPINVATAWMISETFCISDSFKRSKNNQIGYM